MFLNSFIYIYISLQINFKWVYFFWVNKVSVRFLQQLELKNKIKT